MSVGLTKQPLTIGRVNDGMAALKRGKLANLQPLLPLFFHLRGKPYSLKDHFVFEPLFAAEMPLKLTLKCARQVGKTQSLAAKNIIQAATIPYLNSLYVTPLFEMARRTSTNYVRPLIEESPLRKLLVDSSCNQSVLQRSFLNYSNIHFSYASLDATRIRGIPSDTVTYDEAQDFDPEVVPIIAETMSGSELWGFDSALGTPLTFDTFLHKRFDESSQAEWHVKCRSCGKENIPSKEFDLDKMIGPERVTREISEAMPGVVCAKCGRPVYPRDGHWVHHRPQFRLEHAGYHVPRILMPQHYGDRVKWLTLLAKRSRLSPAKFYNEVCGESYDFGAKLVSKSELIHAARDGGPNTLVHARTLLDKYIARVVAVDWGGGGETETSTTVVGVLGYKPDGNIDVIFAHRFRVSHDYFNEAVVVTHIMRECRCHRLVHDYGGAGTHREALLARIGVPENLIVPCVYQRVGTGPIMRHKAANPNTEQRAYYQIDKARSLLQTCHLIRHGGIKFFESDYGAQGQTGLLNDFLALTEHRMESHTGSEVTTIIRAEKAGPDDFAQMVNIGSCALYQMQGRQPDLAAMANYKLDPQVIRSMFERRPDWENLG